MNQKGQLASDGIKEEDCDMGLGYGSGAIYIGTEQSLIRWAGKYVN